MRGWLLAAALLAAAAAIGFARPHPTPGPPMRDFEAYYAAGAVWDAGGDAYSQAIWRAERQLPGVRASRYEALPFVGPPALLPIFGAIAKLPFAAANVLWRALLLATIACLALLTLRLARIRVSPVSFIAIALAAIGFGPLTSALALGQLALPAMLFAALATISPAAGVLAWIQPNVGFAVTAQKRAWVGAAAFAAICAAVAGAPGVLHYINVVHRHSLGERFSAIQITPASIAYGFGVAPAQANAAGAIVALAAICCWFLLMRAKSGAAARFCGTCALLPLGMPFFHEHDLIVLFVPAVVYAARCADRLWPLAASGALLAGTDWLGLAQRPDALLQTVLLVAALSCALIALRIRPHARMLIVPGLGLVLIAVAGVLARAHPAPVWPDAMHALPQNLASLDLASAWSAQQQAAGLFAIQPVWALLRALSLAGCALTAAAVALSSKSPADSRSPSPVPA